MDLFKSRRQPLVSLYSMSATNKEWQHAWMRGTPVKQLVPNIDSNASMKSALASTGNNPVGRVNPQLRGLKAIVFT